MSLRFDPAKSSTINKLFERTATHIIGQRLHWEVERICYWHRLKAGGSLPRPLPEGWVLVEPQLSFGDRIKQRAYSFLENHVIPQVYFKQAAAQEGYSH